MILYRRLIAYARPYSVKLAVGILLGFIVGGTIFPLLSGLQNVFRPFDNEIVKSQAAGDAVQAGDGTAAVPPDNYVYRMARRLGVSPAREDGRMTWQFMLLTLFAMPFIVLLRAVADYGNQYYMKWVGARMVMDLRNDLFRSLQSQSLKFYARSDVGQLISNCTNDAAVVENLVATTVSDMVRAPIEILFAAAFVVVLSVREELFGLVLLLFVLFPLCVVPIVILGRFVRRYALRSLERVSGLVSRMHESFTGIRVIKAFNTEQRESDRFAAENLAYFKPVMRALKAELLMTPLMEVVGILLAGGVLVICYARDVKLSQIVPLMFAGVVVYKPLKQLARINAGLQRGAAALERLYGVLDTDMRLKESINPVEVGEFRNSVVFEQVCFSYVDGGPDVVSNISFSMPRGSVVAVVGQTGSGKTTIANLLARFYDATSGRVMLDGLDLRNIRISSLRAMVGVVTQETVLFNDTIANNIAYGVPNATREQIEMAARQANAHDFIVANAGGYDRIVGEKGFVLSGGERQRIAIARAILLNPPIMILDEATNALDTVTERLVQEAIARVMQNRTVFAIAHRLSTVKHANLILVIDGGRIVEQGTHDHLYAAGGRYRKLCDMQMVDVARE